MKNLFLAIFTLGFNLIVAGFQKSKKTFEKSKKTMIGKFQIRPMTTCNEMFEYKTSLNLLRPKVCSDRSIKKLIKV